MKKRNHFDYIFIGFIILSLLSTCNSTELEKNHSPVLLYRTTMDQSKLLEADTLKVKTNLESSGDALITLRPEIRYQTMDGFGYTLTGGSALHLQGMSKSARDNILKELFARGEDGIGVNYLRISIGASDLDEYPWSYNDRPKGGKDEELEHFSLAYDTLYLIPTLREILAINPSLKIMGSPWSPPTWMKDNTDTRGGSLLPKYYSAYANYFVKYIKSMAAEGIPIDAVTVQNEPLHPGNNPSLLMLAKDQAEFIKKHLGPAFRENDIKTKIIIYDHNADRPDYPIAILNDKEAAQYIDGSAFHLYGGPIDTLTYVHESHPDKHLYFTEQWIGAPGDFAENVSWHVENLIIGAPRNWCRAVLEWNLAADENQLPHTDRGGCTRCLGAITIVNDTVIRNPAYYIIAHASKFVPTGSTRIDSNNSEEVINVAYSTPDKQIVVILQNKKAVPIKVQLVRNEKKISIALSAKEVATLVWP
jgi:glucosylceramidase